MSDPFPTFDGKGLGALPDPEDQRDHLYSAYLDEHPEEQAPAPPPKGEVAADAEVPILDQGELGSCTANEGVAHYAILLVKQGKPPLILSRLEVYFDARKSLGLSTRQDTGATGRAVAKTLATKGACPEDLWPYDIARFAAKPANRCLRDDANHNLIEYLSIPAQQATTLDLIKTSLAAGFPVGFSIGVYANFRPDGDGIIPLPAGKPRGGHRIMLVGYDDATQLFKVRNSWGTDWGKNGRCFFHFDHILQQASDFWVYRHVEN